MAGKQRVTLMSDYFAGWPLWSDDGRLTAPESFALSPALVSDLKAWEALFEREFRFDREPGWSSPEAEAQYARDAAGLLHRLRRELGPGVQVSLDAWPVGDPALRAWLSHRDEASP
jgi:hypothetical protein